MGGQWILWFEEFGREDTKRVGSKCANIGEMAKIGISVPPGFAVTTETYDEFLAQTGAGQRIEQYLIRLPEGPQTPADHEEASQTIAGIILTTEMPKDLENAVSQAYDELCQKCQISDVAVAVRSSGVAEDLPTASFAGQYETYLNVRGKDDLLEKIRRCWASLFTKRAISYRIQNKLPVLAGSISVAVQKMVNVRSAGVGFTIHPTTGDDTKIVLEGNWGAGESVVQGTVTPDRFIVDKHTLTLTEKNISQKMRQIVLKERGVEEEDVPPDKQSVPCLTDEEALRIAELAKSVELHYGSPQDIEWAVDRDFPFPRNTFLVQTRPVTAIVKKKTSELIVDSMLRRLLPQRPRG
jgi:pyruvate,water dikinase